MKKYDFGKIESKWQKAWQEGKIYEPDLGNAKKPVQQARGKPFYNLMMFPYPSAEGLHVGNMYAFTGSDVYGRFKRMQGNDVFEPIGLDGFGIHSENYALKIGAHPMTQAEVSEKRFYEQLAMVGNGFAWNERLETYDPEYYKWTQWIFIQMWKHGLAYRKKQPVNWCPSCKTVLADEQVISGKCERCGTEVMKKELEQWFFRITKYAERLLKNIEKINWSEKIKIAQRNWIGRSEGAAIRFSIVSQTGADGTRTNAERLHNNAESIEVFTTRPDTLFGATYMVLAPEHELISNLKSKISNFKEVEKYIETAKKKSEEERTEETKEKTGVELKGIKAINPTNNEEIPIFVADYVLSGYGTGAIMAVPAHDERDWEFAKKFKIPIKQVIAPKVRDNENPPKDGKTNTRRNIIHCLVKHPTENKLIALRSKKLPWLTPITGGIEDGEDILAAAEREIHEETGYKNLRLVKTMPFKIFAEFYAAHKDVNRLVLSTTLFFELKNEEKDEISPKEQALHDVEWVPMENIGLLTPVSELPLIMEWFKRGDYPYIGEGFLMNSGKFDEMNSEEAKWAITKLVGGERKVQYRLRDWLLSRQRYWGAPIPMIFCDACAEAGRGEHPPAGGEMPGWYAVPEKDLPVKLPHVKEFRPQGKGESPLASVKEFYETKCPACGAKARRETDVSDTFLDSAWYFLRYPSVGNKKEAWDKGITEKWLPVNMYIGGAEHAVLHLLYSRFVTMAFHDFGMLDFEEPFTKFRAHGLIIKEGTKMSKSKGNIVNPDEFIQRFGADAFRTYLMFLAPFEQGGDFRDQGILGITRFLDRVWKMGMEISEGKEVKKNPSASSGQTKREMIIHQTIKKVTEDIEGLQYNTAISTLMVLLNGLEKGGAGRENFEILLKLLAPFSPHITEELWYVLGNTSSIHVAEWPEFNPKLELSSEIDFIIQVNGKHRGTLRVNRGVMKEEIEKLARAEEKVMKALKDRKVLKVIFVPDRLINFVVEPSSLVI